MRRFIPEWNPGRVPRSRRAGSSPRTGIWLAPWILLPLTVGCGEEPGPAKFPVSGKVTVDGQPLETGSISFLPSASGPAASASIEGGAFSLDRAQGPGQGPYKVEIVSIRPTGKTVESPDEPGTSIEEMRNIIPVRYNARSELSVQVKPDGENSFRFEISSHEPKPRSKPRRKR